MKKNKKNIIIPVIVLLLVVGALVVLAINRPEKQEKETVAPKVNPVIESYKKQAEILPEAIKKDPKNVVLVHQYAVSLFATGKFDGAKDQYLKEIDMNPKDPVVFNNLGNVYRELRKYNEAVTSYEKSIELSNKENPAYSNLANMYLLQIGDKNKAIEVYKKALVIDPNNKVAKEGLTKLGINL